MANCVFQREFKNSRLTSDSSEVIKQGAISGMGIIIQAKMFLEDAINTGLLVPILENYPLPARKLNALYLRKKYSSARVNFMLEALQEAFPLKNNLATIEQKKPYPERYPANFDSLGIEIVGKPTSGEGGNAVYEKVNDAQNSSLRWLVAELTDTLKVSMTEIFRHPEVSYKVKTEAGTARW